MTATRSQDYEDAPGSRWGRRDQKRRPRMRLHGQGMKKLAARLGEKAPATATKKKKRSSRSR